MEDKQKKDLPAAYALVQQALQEASIGKLPLGFGAGQLWMKLEYSMKIIGEALKESYPEETPADEPEKKDE